MNMMIMLVFIMLISTFIFGDTTRRTQIAEALNTVFFGTIGFNGHYVLITIFLSGCLVTILSSFFTNLFTDWIAVGHAQEKSKAFQDAVSKARREGNTNKVNKLMTHQKQLMADQQAAQSGMMKPMIFLFIFIAPIYIWLMYFISNVPYFYFTVPWSPAVPVIGRAISIMSDWFLLYMVFTMVFGQIIRALFKYGTWSFLKIGQKEGEIAK